LNAQATGENVIVRKDKRADRTEGGLILPDVAQERSGEAAVMSVGPKCWRLLRDKTGTLRKIRPGDRIRFHPLGQIAVIGTDDAIIRESAVLSVIEE
jgi:co-chaperonin GroES (HSP10)